MLGQVTFVLVGGMLAALPFVSSEGDIPPSSLPQAAANSAVAAPATQDPGAIPRIDSRWTFALLQYTTAAGKTVDVPARNLAKIWVLTHPEGHVYLELLYENTDYSMIRVADFHIIRRSEVHTAADVPVQRTTMDGMVFPNFARKNSGF